MTGRLTNKQLSKMFEEVCANPEVDCSSIMEDINSGRVNMRSRWFILSEYLGLRTSWVLLLLVVVALINITLYMLSKAPEWEFLEFGRSSYALILKQIPYGWMALILALLIVALLLMSRFAFSYARSYKVFSFILLGGVLVIGGGAFASGVNDTIYAKYVQDPEAKDSVLAKVYCFSTNQALDSHSALRGEVMFIENEADFVVETPDLEIVTVMTGPKTKWFGAKEVEQFEFVKMIGEHKGDYFMATHVKVMVGSDLTSHKQGKNCFDQEIVQRNREVKELRRRALRSPITPSVGTVQLIRSIR